MIDIHSHILAGIDDGAKDFGDTLNMLRHAANEGITKIIATPHHNNGKYVNNASDIKNKVIELNERIKDQGLSIEILPGQETRIYGDLLEDYEKGEILTLNHSKYLFIELPSNHVPRYTKQLLFDIQLAGLLPIIVHPERNSEIIEHPSILYKLIEKGAATQVTASSVTGHFGKKIKKFSLQLIEAGQAHFIASDAHNLSGRTFRLREAYDEIGKEFGSELVYMFQENAELVVEGNTIYRQPPLEIKKKKFLGIF
ncbi:tyrosine-protein phosphatase [Metabacillus litoralis]|uniref:tyrosine-protein phosphatase n=1 Tax=Metabacillus litoralis TaxID=152268 RepID=UPI00203A4873|nr:CpsB/CapC family capsule biosynthesis tyrosine phosphatase [Metabacillus litoralis]MCM3163696.1 tyrosine protein phosphatase [Metabacillus litoralis]MCM3409971.1 tyrosine protein phosphatase [Metabacillus litoralis]